MTIHNLSKSTKVVYPLAAVAAGTGDTQTSSTIDTKDGDAIMLVVLFGTITATGTVQVKLQHSSDDGATDPYADVAGSGISCTAAVESGKAVVLDIYKPTKRYLKVLLVRAVANAVINGVVGLVYHIDTLPVANDANVTQVKVVNTPFSGTA